MEKRFSERIGKKVPRSKFQIDSMDMYLRNSLWNAITIALIKPLRESESLELSEFEDLVTEIWIEFLKEPVDQIPYATKNIASSLRDKFYQWNYLDVYDFIEFLSKKKIPYTKSSDFRKFCNIFLEKEFSAYKFVDSELTQVTDQVEIDTIESALQNSDTYGHDTVKIHLKTALLKLADRENPDYRNSIKESISAIESLCKRLTNEKGGGLEFALKKLKKETNLHASLEQALLKIYGYTSDSSGIRHALIIQENVDKEDAQFMLVACSAFVNYLIVKYDRMKKE